MSDRKFFAELLLIALAAAAWGWFCGGVVWGARAYVGDWVAGTLAFVLFGLTVCAPLLFTGGDR